MAVYCLPKTDEVLIGDIGNVRRILLIGCPACANISYLINQQEDGPILKLTLSGIKAICVRHEAHRISKLLAKEGKSVDSWLPNAPGGICALDESTRKKLFKKGQDSDSIITLSCESGNENIKSIFPDKKVVGAMNAKGILRGVMTKKLNKIYIKRQTIDILSFNLE